MKMFLFICFILLCSTIPSAYSSTCDVKNEETTMNWHVENNQLEIHFEHNNLTENRWTSIAFGNGPGMNGLESIIFSRGNDNSITTNTGFTPKKKKVEVDDVSYVTVKNVELNGDKLKVTVTRPLGPAGPRNFSLDQCVNWIIVPGGSVKDGKFKKHHGRIYFIKNVCAAQCTREKKLRVMSNRIQ
ncbi:hypothetical protein GCK72_013351 [Caenorhabditis remanei]|uniref:DOMON domain-containing protein n=1 Tax=Caenorhabditis remanei TaxID=31234 RepID=A0A6A5GNV8_CAERE|nr:hypothetical protein GCK72_013351 [Caenorhabditis remanei]KAF1756897.1 hypothetical protein GCK72_013351 [Caenorhabditis remanei]